MCCDKEIFTDKGLYLPWNNSEDTNVKVCKDCSDEMYHKEIGYVEELIITKHGE